MPKYTLVSDLCHSEQALYVDGVFVAEAAESEFTGEEIIELISATAPSVTREYLTAHDWPLQVAEWPDQLDELYDLVNRLES